MIEFTGAELDAANHKPLATGNLSVSRLLSEAGSTVGDPELAAAWMGRERERSALPICREDNRILTARTAAVRRMWHQCCCHLALTNLRESLVFLGDEIWRERLRSRFAGRDN